jgi:hypothetical protein
MPIPESSCRFRPDLSVSTVHREPWTDGTVWYLAIGTGHEILGGTCIEPGSAMLDDSVIVEALEELVAAQAGQRPRLELIP